MTVPGQFDHEDRAALSDELVHIKKQWWVFPDWAMVLGGRSKRHSRNERECELTR
jgi:hypothetical protein